MKNVQYIGNADTATVGKVTFRGHGDVQAMGDDRAEQLAKADPARFRLPGGPTPGSGTERGAQGDQGSAQDAPGTPDAEQGSQEDGQGDEE